MELRDFIVTPIVIVLIYMVAYMVRSKVTTEQNKSYFISALTVRIMGALALGFIYQFYYNGGDTYNFHTHGSRFIWEAFWDSPSKGIDMLLSGGVHEGSFYKYSSQIYFFSDPSAFFVIKFAAILDLFTCSTYSATAVLFAAFSFIGAWMFFLTFEKRYPDLRNWIAAATLFIPSVFFWGSGLLKDTLVLSCLGIMTFEIDRIFLRKEISFSHVVIFLISFYFIFCIKKFVLQAFIPAAVLWIYIAHLRNIRSMMLRIMIFPFIVGLGVVTAYYSAVKIGEGDVRYAVDNLAETAKITAIDIRYQSGKDAGSGYSLGNLDGSFSSMLKMAPQAINVSLYRPYLWEVKNPLMLLSALESITLLFITIYIFLKKRAKTFKEFKNPDITFCIFFSLVFAFAVGISTYNFGTLARYKIPLLPFFFLGLILMLHSNKDKKVDTLDEIE